jgi:hypothetical protein
VVPPDAVWRAQRSSWISNNIIDLIDSQHNIASVTTTSRADDFCCREFCVSFIAKVFLQHDSIIKVQQLHVCITHSRKT